MRRWCWNDEKLQLFQDFLWKNFYFDHQFSTIWKTNSLREFDFLCEKKHFFDEKIFFLKEKKRGKNWIFFIDFLSMIQFIIWKKSLNFRRKWVFNFLVVWEVTVIFDIVENRVFERAIDWIKIMKSKCSIMIKIITSEVDLYLFLQRL